MNEREVFIGKDTKLLLAGTGKFAIETPHLTLLFDDFFPFNGDSLMLHANGYSVATLHVSEESLEKFKFFVGKNL